MKFKQIWILCNKNCEFKKNIEKISNYVEINEIHANERNSNSLKIGFILFLLKSFRITKIL